MSEPSVGFVGGGRVARILLGGWTRARRGNSDVIVSDADAGVLERLRAGFPAVSTTENNLRAAKQDIVFLGLHPPAFPTVLPQIKDSLSAHTVLVSLAPKWTMSRICGLLGGFSRLARVIPNAPSIVNKGYNPVVFAEQVSAAQRQSVLSLLTPLGTCPEVPEATLEAYAIVAAMGPTYLWYQLYELVDLGCEFGLTREAATQAVAAMVVGTAETLATSGLTPPGVMDLIPVKPLAGLEEHVKENYRQILTGLHQKLTT